MATQVMTTDMTKAQIYTARVMHKRLLPKQNAFHYGVYYLALPLPVVPFRSWLTRFHAKDIGPRDGSDPLPWVRNILARYGLNDITQNITLVTMPRVLGYVFNPVSFYLCFDINQNLRAVLCEVHNTFGEQHCYLCAHGDHRPLGADDVLQAEKVFHVSPFLATNGRYSFRFDLREKDFNVWIDYINADENKQLITSLGGTFSPLNTDGLRSAFWRHPLVALKAMSLIHWQALRLALKGIAYRIKPTQGQPTVTATHNLKKR